METLKKQLEEAQNLKDQAKKSREEAEKAKVEAKQETNKAKQKGYNLGVAETKETLRTEVPMVCHITAPKLGMKPLTELGLRLHLSGGRQRICSILWQSVPRILHPLKSR